jgi:putative DNA primase/helicase
MTMPHEDAAKAVEAAEQILSEPVQPARELPPPSQPLAVAELLAAEQYTHPDGLVLRHWRGGWWQWRTARWVERELDSVRSELYAITGQAWYWAKQGDELVQKDWAPTRHKISDVLEALAAVCHLDGAQNQPTWLDGRPKGPIVACTNGLLDVAGRVLLPHTPAFFNVVRVPFDYDSQAPTPRRWLQFLGEIFENDAASIAALQEWFGYVIAGRLDLQKILLWIGRTRSGKGASARVLSKLIGRENVAGPTLSSLGSNFGLAPLIGKPLAVVADARLDVRSVASNAIVERLLSISGEDSLTVDIKYREQWTGKLPTRFWLISNELPHLGDASMAVIGRFVILNTTRSWLGREDLKLEPALETELAGILNWALEGLARLSREHRFTHTPAADEIIVALQELASPVGAFVRDRCQIDASLEVVVDDLYSAWKHWAEDNGQRAKTKQNFSRDLRAVVPRVKLIRPRTGADANRLRLYRGLGLRREEAEDPPWDGPSDHQRPRGGEL